MERLRRLNYHVVIIIMLAIVTSCGGSSDGGNNTTESGINGGLVQKGPFSSGSMIIIQELDSNLVPNGVTFNTVTHDDFGSFSLPSGISSNFIEIIAQGFYFNEVQGELSDANLTLRALIDYSNPKDVNVNILTTLSRGRIKYLVNNRSMTLTEAKSQAEKEILAIFGIDEENLPGFEQMDITKVGVGDAILLAISATLQGSHTVAELSELLSRISLDIEEDGSLDNSTSIDVIRNNGKNLSLSEIQANLENRYYNLGQPILTPRFEDYVDSDGDGIVNKYDDDTYVWSRTTDSAPWAARQGHTVVEFDDKIWVIGGQTYNNGWVSLNDVWFSFDGVSWTRATDSAPWSPRYDHTSVVFDNKIWVIGGQLSNAGTMTGDVWYSTDGVNWTQATAAAEFGARSAHTSVVFDNKMWVIAGHGYVMGGAISLHDVWYSANGLDWTQATDAAPTPSSGGHASAVFDNKIWIVGGSYANPDDANDVWYSFDGVNWLNATDIGPWGGRIRHTCVSFEGKLWILGGDDYYETAPYNGHVWNSVDGETWIQVEAVAPWGRRIEHASVVFDNKIWILGGGHFTNYGVAGNYIPATNDVWCYEKYVDH